MKWTICVCWLGSLALLTTIAFSVWQLGLERERGASLQVLALVATQQKTLLQKYPGDRDLMINLARLYESLGATRMAQQYGEHVRQLDPNNPALK